MRAATHQQGEMDSVTGPQTYDSGAGFSVRSDLGRVDEAEVWAGEDDDNKPFDATVTVQNDNELVIHAYSQATGVEAADDTDLSSINFTWLAERL